MALTQKAAHRKDLITTAKLEHRHFATIAQIIRGMNGGPSTFRQWTKGDVAEHFANELRSTNPNFNRERFIAACLHTWE